MSLADSFNQMAESLEQQERLRREFIVNAAHELRTPLTNLQGYLEALRDHVIAPNPEIFASLHEEVDRLVRLSHSLDSLAEGDSRMTPLPLTTVDLGAAVRSAVDLARPAFDRRGITIETRLPLEVQARSHPDQLAQVLANLLQNASRYTPEGGRVTVAAELRLADVLVSVVNSGDGIPDATLLPGLVRQRLEVLRVVEHHLGGELVAGALERVGGAGEVGGADEDVVRLEGRDDEDRDLGRSERFDQRRDDAGEREVERPHQLKHRPAAVDALAVRHIVVAADD